MFLGFTQSEFLSFEFSVHQSNESLITQQLLLKEGIIFPLIESLYSKSLTKLKTNKTPKTAICHLLVIMGKTNGVAYTLKKENPSFVVTLFQE